jgi:four helix bundle protein
MNFEEWQKNIPVSISGDPLWKVEAYRLALFAADIGWKDVTRLAGDKRTLDLSNQLYRSLGSIGANISEGYSRGTGRDRARFYEYSLGSARESRGWYYNGRFVLGEKVTEHRLSLHTQIVRLLLTMVPEQRGSLLQEESPSYRTRTRDDDLRPFDREELNPLLEDAPLP